MNDSLKENIWKLHHKMNTVLFPITAQVFYFLPVKRNRIVVCNYHGKGYGDNPKYIIEKLLEWGNDIEIIWLVDKKGGVNADLPSSIKVVQYYTMESMYYLATASVWIDNCRKDYAPKKKNDQLYLQTWHGGLGFKLVERKCVEDLPPFYLKHAQIDAKMTDLMLSNSKKTSEIIYDMFWYNGKILEAGLPRNDELFRNTDEKAEKVHRDLGISSETHIVLYAPTFRDQYDLTAYDLELNAFASALEKKFGGEWIGVYRLHPNIKSDASKLKNFKGCIDATRYADSTALLSATDVFISDFSSMVFDFVLSEKPAFLYATDYETYAKTRGVWLSFEKTPFPYAFNNEELLRKLNEFDTEEYTVSLKHMMDDFEIRETGRASDIVAKVVVDYVNNCDLDKALEGVADTKVEQRYIAGL